MVDEGIINLFSLKDGLSWSKVLKRTLEKNTIASYGRSDDLPSLVGGIAPKPP